MLLRQRLGESAAIDIDEAGIPGEMATETMVPRLTRILEDAAKASRPYGWVSLLGGTNDLFSQVPGDEIFASLEQMATAAAAHGARPVLINIPEASWEASDGGFREERQEANRRLRELAARQRWPYVDFASHMPVVKPNAVQARWWEQDGVHCTPAGYDHLGQILFEAVRDELPLPSSDPDIDPKA
eukprot:tig00001095_g7028.t1